MLAVLPPSNGSGVSPSRMIRAEQLVCDPLKEPQRERKSGFGFLSFESCIPIHLPPVGSGVLPDPAPGFGFFYFVFCIGV